LKKKLLNYVIQNITKGTFLKYQKFMEVGEEDMEVREETIHIPTLLKYWKCVPCIDYILFPTTNLLKSHNFRCSWEILFNNLKYHDSSSQNKMTIGLELCY